MKTLSTQIFEAKERTYKEVLSGFYKQGYANYGFIHFFNNSRGLKLELDYPDEDKKYSEEEIAYCPQDLYYKPGESPYKYKVDKALVTGDNEHYNQFSPDYGVFWSVEYKYFYFVKLTDHNKKYLPKYITSRTTLKDQKAENDKKQAEQERKRAEWAAEVAREKAKREENQKIIDEFKEKVAKVNKEAEKFKEEWEKNPEAFPNMPSEVWRKFKDERTKNERTLEGTDRCNITLDPIDLYPYTDVQIYDDPYYGHDEYIRLIKYDGKKYSYKFKCDRYPRGTYWGD